MRPLAGSFSGEGSADGQAATCGPAGHDEAEQAAGCRGCSATAQAAIPGATPSSHQAPSSVPVALYGLLFTVVILFAPQGKKITSQPLDVARIALPLLAYFAVMWLSGFAISRRLHLSYPRTAVLAFSAASNDFEPAIAVAIGVFGVTSEQALASVVGPLIEVPVLLGLVYLALWARRRFYPAVQEATP